MSEKSGVSDQVISLPQGGGALSGIGEKFSPDLFTGTGNFSVPIALPSGRNGFQPELNLVYSTGTGNGPYGLGWSLSIPGVSRQTSKGVPRYEDQDTFVLSGAEDLVPVKISSNERWTQYRPRTEGLFAQITRHQHEGNNYWEVKSKDGLISYYGTPRPKNAPEGWEDPAVIANPDPFKQDRIFSWKLTRTEDPFKNCIIYKYDRDRRKENGRNWDQLYLQEIQYVDYSDSQGNTEYLVSIIFDYEERSDPFSAYRAGFEIRTTRRCKKINIRTKPGKKACAHFYGRNVNDPELPDFILTRTYSLDYENDVLNGVSLLKKIKVTGHDDSQADLQLQSLPPLEFGYTTFEPERRHFFPLESRNLPTQSLSNPELELADLFGNGLPDLIEMNGRIRYWRNRGDGRFDLPRFMAHSPAGLTLADSGVQLIDAQGDGRIDLLASQNGLSGFFPLNFNGAWDRQSYQRYDVAPSFNLEDPEVQLVDLTGNGVTDAVRSGSSLECFFNDPDSGWGETRFVARRHLDDFPDVNFSDPRVKWGDLSGDGLQDIILVHDGHIAYWPNLGHGKWAPQVHMETSPRFPYGFNPQRLLVGDVDGDGLADLVYVEDTKVTLWINQSGNGWSDPITIVGTPPVSDMDAVRLTDMLGTGINGVLWSRDRSTHGQDHYSFLDFTGGLKPYLLHEMDNHMGAITRVQYQPSTPFYQEDERQPETAWLAPLPFPVQVVAQVQVIDTLSQGKLTTEYRYHHGYWDGDEREFRGFGLVEQFDTESSETYSQPGLHGTNIPFEDVDEQHFSPPTLTKTWFQQGPVVLEEDGGHWRELDWSASYWVGDPQLLAHTEQVNGFLKTLHDRQVRRDALRSLRGRILRTELYALDGSERQDRPYTVTEFAYNVCEIDPPDTDLERLHIFFPHTVAQRTTQWERGDDPMTQFAYTGNYDNYGQPRRQTQIACPRGWRTLQDKPEAPYLATRSITVYAEPNNQRKVIMDRVARATIFEIKNKGRKTVEALRNTTDDSTSLTIIGQTLNFYDGDAFTGLPFGQVGDYGAVSRTEMLVLNDEVLKLAYPENEGVSGSPDIRPYWGNNSDVAWSDEYPQTFLAQLPGVDTQDSTRPGLVITPLAHGYAVGGNDSPYSCGYYVATARQCYDFQDDRNDYKQGLLIATLDPLGLDASRDTRIAYAEETLDVNLRLLPTEVTDPAGLITKAIYDYRVLQPSQVSDANDNRTAFTFTPLGLLESTAVMGKPGEGVGDEGPEGIVPSTSFIYNFEAFLQSDQPVSVRTTRRVYHITQVDVPAEKRDETISTTEYSDGFGRLLQTRSQGEELRFGDSIFGNDVLPSKQGDPATTADVVGHLNTDTETPNVVVSGWQVYDNKGQAVAKYEPFFSTGWAYRTLAQEEAAHEDSIRGQKVTMRYDPRGQVILTLNPDRSEQRVIYGIPRVLDTPEQFIPTPWEAYTYDANDNAGRTHKNVSESYKHHWETPASIMIDALGRTIVSVERNREPLPEPTAQEKDPSLPPMEEYVTCSAYDIRGNLLTVTDALGRQAFSYVYDLADQALRIDSMDAGVRRLVLDATGSEVERRDSKGALVLQAYDDLHRPTHLWARDGWQKETSEQQSVTLRERIAYGDELDDTLALPNNLRGQPWQHDDEAGRLSYNQYDFKGNLLEKIRQVISDAALLDGWVADWAVENSDNALDDTVFQINIQVDALNRPWQVTYPAEANDDHHRAILEHEYNRAGALQKVRLDSETYVSHIAYNAKGQRTLIAYGNGVVTRYAYEPETFRLARLRSEQYLNPLPSPYTYRFKKPLLQDFAYVYDLVGNILQISDETPGCGVTETPVANRDRLTRRFEYDPLYRLTKATGRECRNIPSPRPWRDDPRCGYYGPGNHGTPNQQNAPDLTTWYWEEYAYDPAGNMMTMRHGGNGTAWTRRFGMGGLTPAAWQVCINQPDDCPVLPGNRLTHVHDTGTQSLQTHWYDDNGNMMRENGSRHFEWDHADRLVQFRNQAGEESSVQARYVYGSDGLRVKKWVQTNSASTGESTVYIDESFELHQWLQKGQIKQNNHLHVIDDQQRIAIILREKGNPISTGTNVQYHLGDHLDNSNMVIDQLGHWFNREEFYPYGETSFGSFSLKRYRFTNKERDEESGLHYHRARYYAPWIGHWTSCDPLSSSKNLNLYQYVRSNPIKYLDPSGEQQEKKETQNVHLLVMGKEWVGRPEFRSGQKGFARRFDTLLNQSTSIEKFPERVDPDERIVLVIPRTTKEEIVRELREYGQSYGSRFEVRKLPGNQLESFFESAQESWKIETLIYIGHGERVGPAFTSNNTLPPPESTFVPEQFAPDALALFVTCNSWEYAKRFTQQTGVLSVGVQGRTLFGAGSEVTAGFGGPERFGSFSRQSEVRGIRHRNPETGETEYPAILHYYFLYRGRAFPAKEPLYRRYYQPKGVPFLQVK